MSEKKRNPVRAVIAVVVIVFGVLLVINGIAGLRDSSQRLFAPRGFLRVEVVDTAQTRQQGLSGREELDEAAGMLFVFDASSTSNCLWMKDMLLSIDMVWLDAEKRVVTVASDVSPDTFPETFCPTGSAQYALEVAAGRADQLGIQPGVQLRF